MPFFSPDPRPLLEEFGLGALLGRDSRRTMGVMGFLAESSISTRLL